GASMVDSPARRDRCPGRSARTPWRGRRCQRQIRALTGAPPGCSNRADDRDLRMNLCGGSSRDADCMSQAAPDALYCELVPTTTPVSWTTASPRALVERTRG